MYYTYCLTFFGGFMKLKYVLLMGSIIFGCGKDTSEEDRKIKNLIGVWDSTECIDRIILNGDNTFSWIDKYATNEGSFWRDSKEINFMFATKAGELYQFTSDGMAMTLVRGNVKAEYVRVPAHADGNKYYADANCTGKPPKQNLTEVDTPQQPPVNPPPPPTNDPMQKPKPEPKPEPKPTLTA